MTSVKVARYSHIASIRIIASQHRGVNRGGQDNLRGEKGLNTAETSKREALDQPVFVSQTLVHMYQGPKIRIFYIMTGEYVRGIIRPLFRFSIQF